MSVTPQQFGMQIGQQVKQANIGNAVRGLGIQAGRAGLRLGNAAKPLVDEITSMANTGAQRLGQTMFGNPVRAALSGAGLTTASLAYGDHLAAKNHAKNQALLQLEGVNNDVQKFKLNDAGSPLSMSLAGKQASLLSAVGGGLGAGVGGLAGGVGGGLMGALTGGALGGGPGAGIGLLSGGALGLGAGAHLGGNIGASIGKKKKKDDEPKSEESAEKDEDKDEDSDKKANAFAGLANSPAIKRLLQGSADKLTHAVKTTGANPGVVLPAKPLLPALPAAAASAAVPKRQNYADLFRQSFATANPNPYAPKSYADLYKNR